MLRSLRNDPERAEAVHLAASDPANPYGALLPWDSLDHNMSRAAGANVILVNGRLAAFFRRRNPAIQVFLPEDDPDRDKMARALTHKLAQIAIRHQTRRGGLLIGTINGAPAEDHFLARLLEESGFAPSALGFQMRRIAREEAEEPIEVEEDA